MWRAIFMAIGISLIILGGECLVVDKAILAAPKATETQDEYGQLYYDVSPGKRDFTPPEWAPWSLLSAGAVMLLYSFTIYHGGDD